jgi:hypothetical protein
VVYTTKGGPRQQLQQQQPGQLDIFPSAVSYHQL